MLYLYVFIYIQHYFSEELPFLIIFVNIFMLTRTIVYSASQLVLCSAKPCPCFISAFGCLASAFAHNSNTCSLACVIEGFLPRYFFFLHFFAAFGTADLTLPGTFLLAAASGCQPPLVSLVPEHSFCGFFPNFPPSLLSST